MHTRKVKLTFYQVVYIVTTILQPVIIIVTIIIIINVCIALFFGLENRDYGRKGSTALTMRHPSIRKSWH
jgi:type IV secretory pathway VirB2 component (pilin)